MNSIETIVFDLGGVLIDWNPRHLYRKVFDTEEEMEYFLAEVCTGPWNAEQDRGRTFEEAIAMKSEEFPKFKQEINLFYSRWPEMIAGPISGTVEILKELYDNRQYRLYALTNWSAQTFPYALEHFPLLRYFEGILVSGKELLIKPDPAIYHLLGKRYDIELSKAVFIDDSTNNIKGANDVGMQGIHFKDPNQLRKDLSDMGLL